MRLTGQKAFDFGVYEARKVFDALEPIVLTAGIAWASGHVTALREAGGWRAILAVVIVTAWTTGRQYFADNSKRVSR